MYTLETLNRLSEIQSDQDIKSLSHAQSFQEHIVHYLALL